MKKTETIQTTDSMKKTANSITRCIINILKFWKICKKKKSK